MFIVATTLIAALAYAYLARDGLVPARAQSVATSWVYALALLCHGLSLLSFAPLRIDFSFFQSVSLVGLAMAIALRFGIAQPSWRALARVGLVLVAVSVLIGAIPVGTPGKVEPWQINLHAALALMGYAVLSLATLQALVFATVENNLKQQKPPLPWAAPLSSLETLLFQLITAGFALLSATLLTGALFTHNMLQQHLAHKVVFTVCAWLLFGILLIGRHRFGWRGRTAVRLTVFGMAVLGLAFLGSKFVLEVLLQRG